MGSGEKAKDSKTMRKVKWHPKNFSNFLDECDETQIDNYVRLTTYTMLRNL